MEPHYTRGPAGEIDAALLAAAERLTYAGCLGDPLTRRRFHLPARLRGCGIRSREALAPMAFVACLVESAVQMMDRRTAAGAVCRGFFPGLQQLFGAGAFDPGGARFHHFLRGDTGTDDWSSADALEESWTALRGRYAVGQTMTGPLDDSADVAGRGAGTHHLQRLITAQVETVQRDRLHREFVQLPVADTRRVAWLAVDRLSSQWVPSWPTDSCELSDLETPEVITTYLGRESPIVRHLAGCHIPCGWAARAGQPPCVCDAHGYRLGLASLPGTDHTECHDACGGELFQICAEAGLRTELQPRHIFHSLIPPAVLMAPGRPPSIVPDAAIDVSLPAAATARGHQPRTSALPLRRLLFDVKTIHAGGPCYLTARARDDQSGAVRARDHLVWPEYLAHARRLDRERDAVAMQQHGRPPAHAIEQRLRSYTQTRGLVFGQFGEASPDVHGLIAAAADTQSRQQWRSMGARSATEYRAFLISRMRRRVGMAAMQGMARHRIARAPYVGVPRRAVVERGARRARDGRGPWAPAPEHFDFYQYQARGPQEAAGA